jgi:hypothetical protein
VRRSRNTVSASAVAMRVSHFEEAEFPRKLLRFVKTRRNDGCAASSVSCRLRRRPTRRFAEKNAHRRPQIDEKVTRRSNVRADKTGSSCH